MTDGGGRCDVGLPGDPGLGSFQAGGDAGVTLALLISLSPGHAVGLVGGRDAVGVVNQAEGFVDFRFGSGWFGPGFGLLGSNSLAPGFLDLVEAAFGFAGFAA